MCADARIKEQRAGCGARINYLEFALDFSSKLGTLPQRILALELETRGSLMPRSASHSEMSFLQTSHAAHFQLAKAGTHPNDLS